MSVRSLERRRWPCLILSQGAQNVPLTWFCQQHFPLLFTCSPGCSRSCSFCCLWLFVTVPFIEINAIKLHLIPEKPESVFPTALKSLTSAKCVKTCFHTWEIYSTLPTNPDKQRRIMSNGAKRDGHKDASNLIPWRFKTKIKSCVFSKWKTSSSVPPITTTGLQEKCWMNPIIIYNQEALESSRCVPASPCLIF